MRGAVHVDRMLLRGTFRLVAGRIHRMHVHVLVGLVRGVRRVRRRDGEGREEPEGRRDKRRSPEETPHAAPHHDSFDDDAPETRRLDDAPTCPRM